MIGIRIIYQVIDIMYTYKRDVIIVVVVDILICFLYNNIMCCIVFDPAVLVINYNMASENLLF